MQGFANRIKHEPDLPASALNRIRRCHLCHANFSGKNPTFSFPAVTVING
jgi:hypothetical protein